MSENTISVDFQKARRLPYEFLGKGLYKDPRTGHFYERPYVDGKQTWRKLSSTTQSRARNELGQRRLNQEKAKEGLAVDPYKKSNAWSVGKLADFYLESGCPLRNENRRREGHQLEEEKKRVEWIKKFFDSKSWAKLNLEDCREYFIWRKAQIVKGSGERTVDLELICLSSILRWALRNPRKTGVDRNPLAHDRIVFQDKAKVRHCRECQPETGDELHALARMFFSHGLSEVLAWQLLLESMIGQRTHELLKLRWDAKTSNDPGFIQDKHLYLYRSKTSKGTFPYCEIHPALAQCLEAMKVWRAKRAPNSQWFFPSPKGEGAYHIDPNALSHGLRRITAAMGLPPRTSHGLRSFYVNVMRSKGISDAEIALRIGHKTGGKLIVDVYGEILPYKLKWLPSEGRPAWTIWLPNAADLPGDMVQSQFAL
jgi:integrase